MGGSGGAFSYSSSNGYKNELDKIRKESYDEAFETNVNALINEKLGSANSRDVEKTREHLDAIKNAVQEDIEGVVELQYGGSVHKSTYVEGLSDVDVLLKINKSELSDKSPKEVLEYIKSRLETKLNSTEEIKIGKLAVTVKYKDGTEIQILPAIKRGENGFKIPSRNGKEWSNVIRPDKFASRLTEVNQNCGGKVIPVIKIVKYLNSKLPPNQQLSGYHIESLAIEIFNSYPSMSRSYKTMLKYFFEKASEKVKKPIKDKTDQSLHVDDDLHNENSPQRMLMSYILSRTYKRMKAADDMKSIEAWKDILGED